MKTFESNSMKLAFGIESHGWAVGLPMATGADRNSVPSLCAL